MHIYKHVSYMYHAAQISKPRPPVCPSTGTKLSRSVETLRAARLGPRSCRETLRSSGRQRQPGGRPWALIQATGDFLYGYRL